MRMLTTLAVILGIGLAASATVARQAGAPGAVPFVKKHIYNETVDPRVDIAAGLKKAHAKHKRVLLDFGGDWCPDCQVLDYYFHQAPNAAILDQHFVLVHVFIGHMDKNLELAARYGVPIGQGVGGVPALAVLDGQGKVLYAQKSEFSNARDMQSASITQFLDHWKA